MRQFERNCKLCGSSAYGENIGISYPLFLKGKRCFNAGQENENVPVL